MVMNKSNIRDISFVNRGNQINKRGWMRILEATVAVMIVSGVLIVVYSRQTDGGVDQTDYFYSLQKQILMDVSLRNDLRLNVLRAVEEEGNVDFEEVNDFIKGKIPVAFNYVIRICELGDVTDFCKIDNVTVIREIRDKDVFVEEVVISAELCDDCYVPRKLRLFIWEAR